MKLSFTIAALVISLCTFAPVLGQTTCSCETPDRICKDGRPCLGCKSSVTCQGGCTAFCGTHDACYFSCRNDILNARITVQFVKKTGTEIVAVLSERTHKTIEFVPFKGNLLAKYDYEIKNDDVFNILHFLYQRGDVKVNGMGFEKFEKIRNAMTKRKKMSVNFESIPVKDALARLSFLSRLSFRIKSGDGEKLLSLSLQKVTLGQIVSRITKDTGVKIEQASIK